MSTDEYVPSEAEMMTAWHRYTTAEDAKHGRLRDDPESPTKEFVRYMDRVRRDAWDECAQWHAEQGMGVHEARTGEANPHQKGDERE